MADHTNPFFEPPDSFEFDPGPERTLDHFGDGHDPSTLELHGGDDIEVEDVERDLDIDLDAIDLDDVGVADAFDNLNRRGGLEP